METPQHEGVGFSTEALLARMFEGLSRVDLAKLAAHLESIELQEGEEVFRQGDAPDALYLVATGRFAVMVRSDEGREVQVGMLIEGDLFGEMGLFTEERRSATVRAERVGRVMRLPRERFRELMAQAPSLAFSIAGILSRRLQSANVARVQSEQLAVARIDEVLDQLSPERREDVLAACLLETASIKGLRVLLGERAQTAADDLAALGASSGTAATVVLRMLRERLLRQEGPERFVAHADDVARRLADAHCWEEALAVLARQPSYVAFAATLGRALRDIPPLPPARVEYWIERLSDDETIADGELALARAALHEAHGDLPRAVALLRRALGAALVSEKEATGQRLAAEITRLSGAPEAGLQLTGRAVAVQPSRSRGRTYVSLALCLGSTAVAVWPGASPQRSFVALLLAGIALLMSRLVPEFAVALALITSWVLKGLAKPSEALAGFATKEWLFIVTVYGLAAAAARSGLLFRVGLLLVRRLPSGLFWKAATMMLTGLAMTPLVPSSTGRASLTSSLALAVSEALRLPERSRASALIGLGTWIGAAPLMFMFLNGSGTCLLAWGLLPEHDRAQFTWGHWLVAAAPLGLFVSFGGLMLLYLMLRPEEVTQVSRERVNLQVALLGPPARRELWTIVVLGLTVLGWILAPVLHLDITVVALLGLLAAVVVGSFDLRTFQSLDWNAILFFGVVLTIARLAVSLGLDRMAAALLHEELGVFHLGPLLFTLAVALLSFVVRLVLDQDLTALLAGLTLIPVAPGVGVKPWVVVITLLATSTAWFLPSQTPGYLVAQSASEGKLFSDAQAQRFAFLYAGLTLIGLALSVPYWHLLGLL